MARFADWIEAHPRWLAFVGLLPLVIGYLLINHFPVFIPRYLPFLFGEEYIPFMSWTGLVYFSLFPFLLLMFYLVPAGNFGRSYLIFYAMCAAHFLIFIFFPTIYPRAANEDMFFIVIKTFDPPNNCFPSMHVSMPIFWVLVILKSRKDWVGGLIFVCAILIALSTLTTKQHYVLDVFGGLVVAFVSFVFAVQINKKEEKRNDRTNKPVNKGFTKATAGVTKRFGKKGGWAY